MTLVSQEREEEASTPSQCPALSPLTMADVSQLLAQLRVAASAQGAAWLQYQVAAVLAEQDAAPTAGGR